MKKLFVLFIFLYSVGCAPKENYADFKAGDIVYTKPRGNDIFFAYTPLLRLIKPTTKDEFNNIPPKISHQDVKFEKGMRFIDVNKIIETKSLKKYKTTALGTYLHSFVNTTYSNGKKTTSILYAIKPDPRLVTNSELSTESLPVNYQFVDENYYVIRSMVQKQASN